MCEGDGQLVVRVEEARAVVWVWRRATSSADVCKVDEVALLESDVVAVTSRDRESGGHAVPDGECIVG